MKTTTNEMAVFTVCETVPEVGASPRFTIHAKDAADALNKGRAWGHRHGFNTANIQGISVRQPTPQEMTWGTHDEWIPG